jgi:hypothetical protein
MRLRSLLPNLALAAASVLVVALVVEGAARVYTDRLQGAPGTVRDPLLQFDPSLGWAKPPGSQATIQRNEYKTDLRINSHGLRGPERDYAKPAGVRRVLLLGDSFVEGYTVAESDTVAAVLERQLGPGWEVLNGGTHGWSTDQEYLFWQQEGVRYRPDDVVLFLYYNDLPGNVSGDGKPYFDLKDGALVLRNAPVPRPPQGQARGDRARPLRILPWHGSMALRLLSNRTSTGNPGLHQALSRLGLVEPYADEGLPADLIPFSAVHRTEVDGMWMRTKAILAALKHDVETAGGRLLIVYVPARFEVNERAWALTRHRYGLGPRWKPERVIEGLRAACDDLGLPLLDPRPEMRALEEAGRPAYFPQDGHWTAAGHEAAARAVAGRLSR